jgi:hypothetical protein
MAGRQPLASWNDGTLCCEQPLQIQFFFAFNRVKELSAKDPTLAFRRQRRFALRGCPLDIQSRLAARFGLRT